MLHSYQRIWGSEMARIAEFLKLPVVLSALLASAGAAAAQAGEPSRGNCESLDKTVRGKVLDARLRGNRYRIKFLDENGRVKVMEIDASAVCNPRRWRFPPEIVLPGNVAYIWRFPPR